MIPRLKKLAQEHQHITLVVIVVVVIFALLNLGGLFFSIFHGPPRDWAERTFAGTVYQVSTSTLTVIDAPGRGRTFQLTPSTTIVEGRRVLSPSQLRVGIYVLIQTALPPQDPGIAEEVRIFSTGRHNSPQRQDL